MREIKFRGRRKNSDEWVYGAFLAIPRLCSYIYDVQPDGQATRYLVDEDTVGQFTGLKDAKGKEIYEGDILLYRLPENMIALNNSDKSVVFYGHGMFLVSHGKIEFSVNQILGVHGDDAVVIGNIHDNPELLGGHA